MIKKSEGIKKMREVAHEYAKFSLTYELKRFETIDSKATKFLSFVSVMFGLQITVVSKVFDDLFPPESGMQCIIVFLLFLLSVFLISSWFYLFRAIKVTDVPTLMLKEEAASFLCSEDSAIDEEIVKIYACVIDAHRAVMSRKEDLIDCAYRNIFRAGVILIPTLFLILVTKQ